MIIPDKTSDLLIVFLLKSADYSDQAIFEGLANHPIHRNYTVMDGELHIDMFTQLNYIEKHSSDLSKMQKLTEKKEPCYKTEASSFFTTFYNLNWNANGRSHGNIYSIRHLVANLSVLGDREPYLYDVF